MSLIIPRVFSKAYFVMFTVFTCSFARNPSNLCSEGASEDPLGSRGVWSPLDSFLRHSRSILRHNHGAWQPTFHHTTHTETLLNKAKQHWNSTRIQKKKKFWLHGSRVLEKTATARSSRWPRNCQLCRRQRHTRTRRKRSLPELVTFQIRPPN